MLTLFRVKHIRVTRVFNKNKLHYFTITGDKQPQKKEMWPYQAKNKCNFDSVWLEKQHGGLHDSSDPCETNRFA